MSREKQIEGMANDICSEYDCVIPCQNCAYYGYANCRDVKSAEKLYTAGYRKASEVAIETIDDFQSTLRHIFLTMCNYNDYNKLNLLEIDGAIEALYDTFIAELKKKYESEKDNGI